MIHALVVLGCVVAAYAIIQWISGSIGSSGSPSRRLM